jgi:hypothetical protein
VSDDPRANPLAGNPLVTRDDLERAVRDLVAPLLPYFSAGGARVRLGSFAAAFPQVDAELEGFARPLWALVPLAAGGGAFEHWAPWVRGLRHGPDPDHAEHWRFYEGTAQTMVEQSVIGLGLALAPDVLWTPLTEPERDRLAAWLGRIDRFEPVENNWQLFRVLVDLGLEAVGRPFDTAALEASLERVESYHLGDGWYADGTGGARDHYVAWAIHSYCLVYARVRPDCPRSARFRERARAFARDYAWWFGPDGGALPFGRSLTYRFAAAAFWSALVLADCEALPWGRVKGLLLRHLRWWSRWPISDRDGVLSIGWAYTHPWMREEYNSAGSPYWALKAFLCLAQPADHPFWTAEEEPMPDTPGPHALPHAGMSVSRDACQAVALSGGHDAMRFFNQGRAKYARFAYSTRFAPGIDPNHGTGESTLELFDPASRRRLSRDRIERHAVRGEAVYSRWSPVAGVRVDTLLAGAAPWHVRCHRIETDRALWTTETGFALGTDWPGQAENDAGPGWVRARTRHGASAIVDLPDDAEARTADALGEPPSTNLAHPFTVLPALRGELAPGAHELRCAVGASLDPDAVDPTRAPALEAALARWFETQIAEEPVSPSGA